MLMQESVQQTETFETKIQTFSDRSFSPNEQSIFVFITYQVTICRLESDFPTGNSLRSACQVSASLWIASGGKKLIASCAASKCKGKRGGKSRGQEAKKGAFPYCAVFNLFQLTKF